MQLSEDKMTFISVKWLAEWPARDEGMIMVLSWSALKNHLS